MRSLTATLLAVTPMRTAGRKTDAPVSLQDVTSSSLHWSWQSDVLLHQFMKDLYLRRGGGDRNFNAPCNVVLDESDLDLLRREVPGMADEVDLNLRQVVRDGALLVYLPKY